tara:strand:- start:9484 stop:10218 length:735 start_codon:yes stop_codon:yes gene_type:complete
MEEIREKIKSFFPNIVLDEIKHKYYIKEEKVKISVSGIIKNFVEHVDYGAIAKKKDKKEGLPKGTYQKLWDNKAEKACAKGNDAHIFGENYAFDRSLVPQNGFQESVVNFWKDLPEHIVPVFTELMMYSLKESKLCQDVFAGTADILLYNTKTGTFIIADYKTNEKLFKNFNGKKLIGIFKDLLENNFNKYQIQFSTYQLLFEQTGYKASSRKLVWLFKDGTYKIFDTDDYTSRIKAYLKNKRL